MATYDYSKYYKQGNDIYKSTGEHLTYEEALPMFQSGFNAAFIQEKAATPAPAPQSAPTDTSSPMYKMRQAVAQNIPTAVPETPTKPPALPTPTAPTTAETFLTSATQNLDASRKAVEEAYNRQIQDLQKKQETATADREAAKTEQLTATEGYRTAQQAQQKIITDALSLSTERMNVEYENQLKIGNELDALLTEGNALIKQQKEVTGLGIIRNPRINQTISDVNARAGVLQAVLSASTGRSALATQQLNNAINAVNAYKEDELAYYKTLYNFYQDEKDTEGNKLIKLDAEEMNFMKTQIGLLETDLANSQATVDNIKEAMSNPETALIYSQAGITLNDSIDTINQKLSNYSKQEETRQTINQMATQGYQVIFPAMVAGKDPSQITRITGSDGKEIIFWKPLTAMEQASIADKLKGGGGTVTERQALLVQSALALAKPKLLESRGNDGYVNPDIFLDLLSDYAIAIGDTTDFINTFSPMLSPKERARLGVGKAVGETATPKETVPPPPDFVKTANDYKNAGWTREQIEKEYTNADKTIPKDFISALDEVFGKQKSWTENLWGKSIWEIGD